MDAYSLASDCVVLLVAIYDAVQGMKDNNKRCERFSDRLLLLRPTLEEVAERNRSASAVLMKMAKNFFADANEKVKAFATKSRVSRAVSHKSDAKDFDDLNVRLSILANDQLFHTSALYFQNAAARQREDEGDASLDFQRVHELLEELVERQSAVEGRLAENHTALIKAFEQLRIGAPQHVIGFTEIEFSSLEVGRRIGRGGFGTVFEASWNGARVAVKRISHDPYASSTRDVARELRREAHTHAKLLHPHIVQLIGACSVDPENLCIVMALARRGSVYDLLHRRKDALAANLVAAMLSDVASGLMFLHSKLIFHRDLKSPNLLLDEAFIVRICDFGLAKVKVSTTASDTAGRRGTAAWMPPEWLDNAVGKDDTEAWEKVDIYSFGIVVYEFLARLIPFRGLFEGQIALKVLNGDRPLIPARVDMRQDPLLATVMERCWKQEPAARPSCIEVLQAVRAALAEMGGDPRLPVAMASTVQFAADDMSWSSAGNKSALSDESFGSSTKLLQVEETLSTSPSHGAFTAPSHALHELFEEMVANEDTTGVLQLMRTHISDSRAQETGCRAVNNLIVNNIENAGKLGAKNACEAVVAALSAHRSSVAVQEQGCRAVNNLTANAAENQRKLVTANACEAVVAALNAYRSSAAIQEQGCQAVHNLARDSVENTRKLGAGGACEAVVAALHAHRSSAAIQEQGCQAVNYLAANATENQRKLVTANACEAVVAALNAHRSSAAVQETGCGAVRNLSVNDAEIQRKLGTAHACEAVVAALNAYPSSAALQQMGCHALSNLAFKNDENQRKLGTAHACEAVVAALSAHRSSAAVQEQGCRAVSSLAFSVENNIKLSAAKVCEAVVVALNAHRSNSAVQEQGCRAVRNLAAANVQCQRKLGAAHACKAVLAALNAHRSSAAVQEHGCGALTNLASNDIESQRKLGAAKACEAVVAALNFHLSDAAVQEQGCRAVRNLAGANNVQNQTKLGALDACKAVVAALNAHRSSAAVQEHGCSAVRNLASNTVENRRKLGVANACEAVVAALNAHRSSAAVQEQGCWAVRNLAANNDENRRKLGAANACEAVVAALNAHRSSAAVQEQACWAVRNLGVSDAENRRKLVTANASEAVRDAMSTHPLLLAIQTTGEIALGQLEPSTRRWSGWGPLVGR